MAFGQGSNKFETLFDHIHKEAKVYPTMLAGITVAKGDASWALTAAWNECIPAATITSPFDIHSLYIESANVDSTFELVLASGGAGSEVEIGRVRFTRTSSDVRSQEVVFSHPIQPANARISAKLAGSLNGAGTVTFSFRYHTY
jgi:hypothetical protein